MTDLIKSVRQFTEAVGCTTDQFNVRQTALYIGLQLEEMAEKLEALRPPESTEITGPAAALAFACGVLGSLSTEMKKGTFDHLVDRADCAAMLDADIDLAWVTLGSAFSQGADVEGAAGEVARANLSKLEDCPSRCIEYKGTFYQVGNDEPCETCSGRGLVAIKDENGKVKKPEGWTPPNIEPFTNKGEKN